MQRGADLDTPARFRLSSIYIALSLYWLPAPGKVPTLSLSEIAPVSFERS
jgi:hypothetical protein